MADYTSREDEDFFAAIGRLVLSWGHVEAGLDMFIMVLHNVLEGRRVEPVIPWALQRKISSEEQRTCRELVGRVDPTHRNL
jgi:hypothetical protein